MNFLKVLSPYRFPEIFQVFGICVSMLFFVTQYPDSRTIVLWSLTMLTSIASAFWLNDYFDFDDDRGNGRKVKHATKSAALLPAVSALFVSLGAAILVSPDLIVTVFLIAGASILYSSPLLRLKSRIFFPFFIHFFMGVVFFQSAASITDFVWLRDTKMMALFWAMILGTGSLGNELVDQVIDENSKIRTVANVYPALIRKIISVTLSLALILLVTNMFYLDLKITRLLSASLIILFWVLKKNSATEFRKMYRIIFIVMIVAFHAEKYLRY